MKVQLGANDLHSVFSHSNRHLLVATENLSLLSFLAVIVIISQILHHVLCSGPICTKFGNVSAVSAKDVPFRGLDDDQSRLGVLTPKNQNFGGANRHFKPNPYKKLKSSYLQNYASD